MDAGADRRRGCRGDVVHAGASIPGAETETPRRWVTGGQLLLGSSFRLALGEEGGIGDGTRWTAWGRAAATRFDGDADGLSLDGDVTTVTLGADAAWSRWLAGVAVAHSTGEGGFRDHDARAGHPDRGTGRLESTLASVHPYGNGRTWGQPADILEARDGSLMVSDDRAGRIYQIRYVGR